MPNSLRLSAADFAKKLAENPDESFVLIYLDKASDDWVIELSDGLDGLLVANLLNVFQGRLLEALLEQKQNLIAKLSNDVDSQKSSA